MTDERVIEKMEAVRADLLEERAKRDAEERVRRRREVWWRVLFAIRELLVLCVGGLVVLLLLQGAEDRRDIQRRQEAQSVDNIRASIAVGTCLRSGAPDVEACALEKFAEMLARP